MKVETGLEVHEQLTCNGLSTGVSHFHLLVKSELENARLSSDFLRNKVGVYSFLFMAMSRLRH